MLAGRQTSKPFQNRLPAKGASKGFDVLAAVTTTTSECAEYVAASAGVCSSKPTILALARFVRTASIAPQSASPVAQNAERVVEVAADLLGCSSESCVVGHPRFRKYLTQAEPAAAAQVMHETEHRFKARGPRGSRALLNNHHIDQTLQRWAVIFTDFYNCPFAMMDFARTGESLAQVSLADVYLGNEWQILGGGRGRAKRPCKTFACVLNTDSSSGAGKHWVVVFVDMRPQGWTVEYFNSAGNPPPPAVTLWMERTADNLRALRASKQAPPGQVTTVPVADLAHQRSRTECGLYTLFYVRARLEGEPYSFFTERRVPDAAMAAFREHVFR